MDNMSINYHCFVAKRSSTTVGLLSIIFFVIPLITNADNERLIKPNKNAKPNVSLPSIKSQLRNNEPKKIHDIKLRSRVITPGQTDEAENEAALNKVFQSRKNQNSPVHLLIQLDRIPSKKDRFDLKKHGIELLSYVPDHAWIASVKANKVADIQRLAIISWIGVLLPKDKLSEDILLDKLGDWHYIADKDEVAVIVHLHQDIELAVGHQIIIDIGGEVRNEVRSIHALTAHVPRPVLKSLAQDNRIAFVETAIPALQENNDGQQEAQNINVLQPSPYGISAAYELDGSNIDVLVYDSGQVDDHVDFGSRLTHGDADSVSSHSTHVAGTIAGDGSNSNSEGGSVLQWHGVAPAANIISYGTGWSLGTLFYTDVGDIESDWDEAKNMHGADLGTASLGSNVALNGYSCTLEGQYGAASQLLDEIVRGSLGEPYITTWAAGNERYGIARCGNNYDTTAPPSCAKNPIQVGASNSNDDSMTSFSSWGACDDGRIKPIITAAGCQSDGDIGIQSTDIGDSYSVKCGTSMATPGVAGMVTLMLEKYRDKYNTSGEFLPSTAKAILMNTSIDAGNTGPDFQFGYGLVDAQSAIDTLIDGRFREAGFDNSGEVDEYAIRVLDNTQPLQVSLAWDDPAAAPYSAEALVNNIDLELISPTGGVIHQTWVLDPANPELAATTGTDTINNQEQVTVNTPEIGVWRVRVSATTVPIVTQKYSLASTHTLIGLNILHPTQTVSEDVGPYDDPNWLLIRLNIQDDHGGALSTPVLETDLNILVGSEMVTNISIATSVGNEFWVLAVPPIQTATGCYDLDVTLFSTIADNEADAVCYSEANEEDVILTLDISGSMASNGKLEAAKDASQFFITMTDINDKIGLVSFATAGDASKTRLVYPLTTVTGDAIKNAVSLAVEGLSVGNLTALGEGLQISNNEMLANADPAHEHTIILLSDGRQNSGVSWNDIEGAFPANTVIHTVGLGPEGDPDDVLLSSIASNHNGNFWRVYTGSSASSGVVSLASDTSNVLADVYRRVAEETFGWQRMWEASGRGLTETTTRFSSKEALAIQSIPLSSATPAMAKLNPSKRLRPALSRNHQVSIEPDLGKVIFAAHWNRPPSRIQGVLGLYRPDGSRVLSTDTDVAGHRIYGSNSGHEQYIISQPQAGSWTLAINGLYGNDAEYIVMAEAKSDVQLLLLSPTAITTGRCVASPVRAALVDHQPIKNASIQARIATSDGNKTTLALYDDGLHGDGGVNDGLYANIYRPCLVETTDVKTANKVSTYQLKVEANGTSNLGQAFERTVNQSFVTAPRALRFNLPRLDPNRFKPDLIDPVLVKPDKIGPKKINPGLVKPGINQSSLLVLNPGL